MKCKGERIPVRLLVQSHSPTGVPAGEGSCIILILHFYSDCGRIA